MDVILVFSVEADTLCNDSFLYTSVLCLDHLTTRPFDGSNTCQGDKLCIMFIVCGAMFVTILWPILSIVSGTVFVPIL